MEKEKDIIEIIADEPVNNAAAKGKRLFKSVFDGIPKRFIAISAAVCAVIIVAAPVIGYNIPKSDESVSKGLNALREKDKSYLSAQKANEEQTILGKTLTERLSEKQKELEKFRTSQDNLSKITDSNAELEAEKAALAQDISEKRATLDNLEASVSSYTNRIITWTSGDYTVGKDVAAGSYVITGTGSIAIARSGKSIANKLLKSDGETFTLKPDDKIHIDGSAKLIHQ